MIEVKDLLKGFHGKTVLSCPYMGFEAGSVHGIAGMNGAGKTTLFNMLAGYLKPDSGHILFNQRSLSSGEVGFLETNNFFYANLTGKEYLDIFPSTNKQFSLENLNQLFQLPLNELIEFYSTGMKKKLALLAVIKQDRLVYIFDEPFNGLDLESVKVLEIMFGKLRVKGKLILISSHVLSPLMAICDKIYHLQAGQFRKVYNNGQFMDIEQELFGEFAGRVNLLLDTSI